MMLHLFNKFNTVLVIYTNDLGKRILLTRTVVFVLR